MVKRGLASENPRMNLRTGMAKASRVLPGRGEGETSVWRCGPGVFTRWARYTPGSCLSSLRLGGNRGMQPSWQSENSQGKG